MRRIKLVAAVGPRRFAADLRSAHGRSPTGGAGQTIAIVDAHDDPTAESDLAVYRSHYGASGSNGSCSPTYLCTATAGFDGPTGLGTPFGTAAF